MSASKAFGAITPPTEASPAPTRRGALSPLQRYALRATAAYALFAVLWIFLSDALITQLFDSETVMRVGTLKGLAFVTLTSGALYFTLSGIPVAILKPTALPARGSRMLPLALLIVLVGAIVGGSITAYRAQADDLRHQRQEELQAIAITVRDDLSDWLHERRGNATAFSRSPLVRQQVLSILERRDERSATALVEALRNLTDTFGYAGIDVWDATGRRIAGSGAPFAHTPELAQAERQAWNNGTIVLADLHHDAQGQIRLALVAPVFDQDGSGRRPVAAIAFEVNPQGQLYPRMRDWPLKSASGELALLRREGGEMLYLSPLRHRTDSALQLRAPAARFDSPEGLVVGPDYRGATVFAALTAVPGTSWQLMAKVDEREAMALLHFEIVQYSLFATVSLAAALFFAGYLRQRERLSGAMREVAQGRALQEAEQRFRATFEQAAVGLCHADAQGRLLRANPLCSQLLGVPEEQLLKMRLFDLLQVEEAQRGVLQAALEGRRPQFSTDVRVRRGHELRGWLRLTVSAVHEDDGSVGYAVVVLDDINTRKAAAYALEQSEARLRSYTDHAPLAVVVIDRFGRLQEANPAALALSGHSAAQAWLQPTGELLSEHGRPISLFAYRPLLRTGKWNFEAQLTRPDGSLRWIAVSAARMDDGCTIAFAQDISERKHEEEALRQAHAVFRNTQEGLVITDARGDIVATNPAFCRITGYAESELLGRNMKMVNSGRHDPTFYRQFWHTLEETGFWQGEIWNRRKNGEIYPEWLTINAVHGPDGELQNYVAACMDITRTKQSEMELERLAHHDALTGLPNRLLLMSTLEHAIVRSQRNHIRGAVLMLDLDRFKNVNDSLGHPAGDQLLQEVAQRLSARLRGVDTVARLGGDEFVVLLEELAEPQDAAHVAQALIEACSVPFILDGGEKVYVGASVGISLFPDDSIVGDRLIQQADAALYSAKGAGRGTYRFFTGAFTREARSRLDMESGLRRALDEQQFSLEYQPLVRAADGSIEGVEALVRWRHPERGMVSPAAFIPLAEETGLIVPLGEWVLRTACEQMRRWQDQGIAPRMIAVNLSPRQFAQPDLKQQIEHALQESGLQPSALELEITETALLDASDAGARLKSLKALGVKLAIDDFGTGYSSLAYLSRFPIDKLKVDQSFVRNIPDDPTDMEIASAVITLARSLKLKVLAEGVETPAQLEFLRERGCDLLQGYLFSKPVPAEQVTALLRAGEPLGPEAQGVVQQAA